MAVLENPYIVIFLAPCYILEPAGYYLQQILQTMKGLFGLLVVCAIVYVFWLTIVAIIRTRKKKRK